MLDPGHFGAVERALGDPPTLRAVVAGIRGELNPHPGDQLTRNIPHHEGAELSGVQHKYAQTALVGAASVYSRAMAAAGMVGWAMTSAASRVAPCHGRTPLFGTNPISVAAGTDGKEFALDIATSQVCQGEIQERGRLGLPLEPGWATDARGHGTRDASAAVALSPLGASGAGHKGQGHKGQSYTGQGHKGQGLAMAVTLMTAVLADAPLDWELDHIGQSPDGRGRRVAHFLLCLDPAAFAGPDPFRRRLAGLVATTRRAP
ncbi:MAG: hypothetical protein HOY75_26300, partial [Streptomyces sp.]|nr:hypothetical protein [Streptomyces sp.]